METQREVDGTGPLHLYIYPPGPAAPRPARLTPPLTFGCLGDVRTGAAMLRGREGEGGGGRERRRGGNGERGKRKRGREDSIAKGKEWVEELLEGERKGEGKMGRESRIYCLGKGTVGRKGGTRRGDKGENKEEKGR